MFPARILFLVSFAISLPSLAGAATFVIDPVESQLTVSAALFHSPDRSFVSDIGPVAGTDFTRQVGGTLEADAGTGVVMAGSVQALGDLLDADQLIFSRGMGGYFRDIGDFTLAGLGVSFDALGNATISSGMITYDVTTGSTRVRSTTPQSIAGAGAAFANVGGPPSLEDVGGVLRLTLPVLVNLVDVPVIDGGQTSFTLSGQIVVEVPEPGTGVLAGLGLVVLAAGRRRRRVLAKNARLVALAALLVVPLTGCPDLEDDEEMLPGVDAIDDSAATQENAPVRIRVLDNDLQDDDLITSLTDAVDDMGNVQPASVETDLFSYPEQITYTPPLGFTGTVTFTYEITGLGIVYDYTTDDIAIVTVTVTEGPPPVDAVDDMDATDIDLPVVVDVLLNDSQDADEIDSFTDAMDDMGNVQAASVAVVFDGVEMLEYTPPAGFEGTVDFEYTIVGAGIDFDPASMDTALVTVDVEAPLMGPAQIQFKDDTTTLEFIEGAILFVGQQAIDDEANQAFLGQLGQASPCFDFPAGVNVPIHARVFENMTFEVDSVCPQLAAGTDYTIRLVDGLDLVCDEGVIADPVACAGP